MGAVVVHGEILGILADGDSEVEDAPHLIDCSDNDEVAAPDVLDCSDNDGNSVDVWYPNTESHDDASVVRSDLMATGDVDEAPKTAAHDSGCSCASKPDHGCTCASKPCAASSKLVGADTCSAVPDGEITVPPLMLAPAARVKMQLRLSLP